jgi:hypothetical protein
LNRNQRWVLRAFALWTVWVWGTRIWNVIGDDTRGTGFKVVHIVLALVSVAFAVATWMIARVSSSARRAAQLEARSGR